MEHNTELDYVDLRSYTRLSCYTCDKTIIWQPWKSFDMWLNDVRKFAVNHSSTNINEYLVKLEEVE